MKIKIGRYSILLLTLTVSAFAGQQGGPGGASSNRGATPSLSYGRGSVREMPNVGVVTERDVERIEGVHFVRTGEYTISSPRPLESAALVLERKLGVPIAFEEATWLSNNDVVLASQLPGNQQVAAKVPNWKGPLVPRQGTLSLRIPDAATLKTANPLVLIQDVLDSHRFNRNSGEYKVVEFGDHQYSIVPSRVEDATGRMVDALSPLDKRVSFSEEDRTVADTLKILYSQINVRTPVAPRPAESISSVPHIKIGAKNEIARDVLARIVRSPGGTKTSWTLFYMPDLKVSFISLHMVVSEVTAANGSIQAVPLTWPKN